MARAQATAVISSDAETLWRNAGGFDALGTWHPWLASVTADGHDPGAHCTALAHDGAEQVEHLEEIDHDNRRYRYSMVKTGLPVTNYVAQFGIDPIDTSSCTVWWHSDFDATGADEHEATQLIEAFLTAGVNELRQQYG